MGFLNSFYFWGGLAVIVLSLLAYFSGLLRWLWRLRWSKRLKIDVDVMPGSFFVQKAFIDEEPPFGRIPTVFKIDLRIFYSSDQPTGIKDIDIEKVDDHTIENFNPYSKRGNTYLIGDGEEVIFICSGKLGHLQLGRGFNPRKDSLELSSAKPTFVTIISEGFLEDYKEKVDVELIIVDGKNRKKRVRWKSLQRRES